MPIYGLFKQEGCLKSRLKDTVFLIGAGLSWCAMAPLAFAQQASSGSSLPVDLTENETEALVALPSLPDLPSDQMLGMGDSFTSSSILGLAAFGGVLAFALITGWSMVRTRRTANKQLRDAHKAIMALQTRLDQSEALLNASDQLMIIWDHPGATPTLSGSLASSGQLPNDESILAFGNWLNSECAQRLDIATEQLRTSGQRFITNVETRLGSFVEIRGRTSGARALLQMRILEGEEHSRAHMSHEASRLAHELGRMKSLLDAVPMPVWSRNEQGQLSWINDAYRKAVDGSDLTQVLDDQTELLDQQGRDAIRETHQLQMKRSAETKESKKIARTDVAVERLPVILAGKRHILDVIDIAASQGNVGIATDVSAVDQAEKALSRMQAFHATTMDQLTTAVAIFDSSQHLQFYNAAFSALFGLEAGFLDQQPSDGAILDRLRANRRLPEQADFAAWKAELFQAYRAVDTQEHWWHLPDGQSLRVVAAPNPDGGVTYIYENVTERLDLEKRYNSLIRVQTETLDHLSDGVVVFGSDGRVQVSNPAFASMWNIGANLLDDQPHVSAVLEWCRRKFSGEGVWSELKRAVAGLADSRESLSGRMECNDERILDYASVPLPDGATMITFVDVTDKVNVERGLTDRNEALIAADQLKNTFIQHVSYELRSPLTNIIGFTELLTEETFGALNAKQREYTDHIMTSSSSLLAIVNDILDLATIDAGIMVLDTGEVDPVQSIQAAAEGLQDRLAEKDIRLTISVAEDMGHFIGDSKRVRQVLYNMISNAIAFSPEQSRISVVADRTAQDVVFSVRDHGCGMPEEFVDTAFGRFESRKMGETRKGAGLGLSIVKSFVELHGGDVSIESMVGEGTVVTCRFPVEPKPLSHAAE
ncbi:MAG: PAS-domain containing protein [Cohaesibacter sp.]|jgi:signal transduction histidine kinase|nr:PAS-domain containing protein [Cohaesibacter sp.]